MGEAWIAVCGIGILCAVGSLILRGKSGEFAALLRVGGLLLLSGLLVLSAREPLGELSALFSSPSLAPYVSVMLKAIGIAILCGICGDICRDCGEASIASLVEIAGNLLILSLCLPMIREILEGASALLELG